MTPRKKRTLASSRTPLDADIRRYSTDRQASAAERAASDRLLSDPRLSLDLVVAVRRAIAAVRAMGGDLWVTDGFRSEAQQERVRQLKPALAASGRSKHQDGQAVDLAGDLVRAYQVFPRFGLVGGVPGKSEPWHVELASF